MTWWENPIGVGNGEKEKFGEILRIGIYGSENKSKNKAGNGSVKHPFVC